MDCSEWMKLFYLLVYKLLIISYSQSYFQIMALRLYICTYKA